MRINAALNGRLEEHIEAEVRGADIGVTRARDAIAMPMRDEIRGHISRALGPKMAKSWKVLNFPRRGNSSAAATFQFDASKDDYAIRAVTESGPIQARNSRWLAIPTESALEVLSPIFHHSRSNRGRGRSRGTAIEAIEKRFGALQFIQLRGQRRAYLVAEVRRTSRKLKSGGTRRSFSKSRRTKTGRVSKGGQTVVMFTLVPQVRRAARGRLDLARVSDRYASRFAQEIVTRWPEAA